MLGALASGVGSCSLGASQLAVGSYPITASFGGSSAEVASTSRRFDADHQTGTDDDLAGAVDLERHPRVGECRALHRLGVSLDLRVGHSGRASGALCTAALTGGVGQCVRARTAVRRVLPGQASFAGSSTFAPSTSAGSTLTVAAGSGPGSSELGVYAGAGDPTAVSDFATTLGSRPRFAMDFLNGTSWSAIADPSWYLSRWAGSGYTMIWGVPILPNSYSPNSNPTDTSGSAYGLAQGASGAFNQYFVTLAQRLVAGGQGSSIIRLGWEFNGGWFPWAAKGAATAFVAYYQQIVDSMRSVAGQDFRFEWNPTAGDQGIGNLANYYPGNAYVDYIGLDLYDEAWQTYTGIASQWETYLTEAYGLDWLASFAASNGKQIVLPEWGLGWVGGQSAQSTNDGAALTVANQSVGGGDDPTFIGDMAGWISQNNVFEANYWDYGTSSVDQGQDPQSAATLKANFG